MEKRPECFAVGAPPEVFNVFDIVDRETGEVIAVIIHTVTDDVN